MLSSIDITDVCIYNSLPIGVLCFIQPTGKTRVLCFIQPTGEAGLEDDTTESDTGSDVNRKRPLDSSEDSSVDIPRIKTPCVDAEDITSD